MSEQENMQATAKLRRSRRTQKQNSAQPPPLPLPTNDDKMGWEVYWKAQGQPWRTEPEIGKERQAYLAERRKIEPSIRWDIYPFKDIKLSRADIEWLLSTHDNNRGPVDWNDESQRERWGLDLTGADLRGEQLNNLPLARIIAGPMKYSLNRQVEFATFHLERVELRAAHLEGAIPTNTHLEGANLTGAHLEGAILFEARLEGANLASAHLEQAELRAAHLEQANLASAHLEGAELLLAHLEGAILTTAHLEGADLDYAHLEGADLVNSHLEGANLFEAHLEGANLTGAHLEQANLMSAHLEQANLSAHLEKANLKSAHLEKADLRSAHLEGAIPTNARLEGAILTGAHLEGADLFNSHLEGAILFEANLEGAYLSEAFFDSATNLEKIVLSNMKYGTASLCDIHWGDVNVAVVDWSTISMLGDENNPHWLHSHIDQYERAARAYRQLSVVLRNQGLNDHAARFAYRAQIMQRKVFWRQRKYLQYLGSLFLDLLSGYGYKVVRSFIAYALVIGVFATIYHLLGTHPAWNESIVISMTAFHGRGFFPEQFHPGDPQALAAAIEALVGLLIEITLIVTLTQRFFGK